MTGFDPTQVTSLLREVASQEILPRFRALAQQDIHTKSGPDDLVTTADLRAEAFLTPRLAALLPGSLVIGEEAVAKDPTVLDRLSDDRPVWIIDPVDGTYNFAHGQEPFAIIVALVAKGETIGGWIFAPTEDRIVTAEKGSGAYLNDVAVRRKPVASNIQLADLSASLYVGPKRDPELYQRLKDLKDELGPRCYARSAGWEYLQFAADKLDYVVFTKQFPWDHAAGCLIAAEAGGKIAYLRDQSAYRPVVRTDSLLIAPDAACWDMIRERFVGPDSAVKTGATMACR